MADGAATSKPSAHTISLIQVSKHDSTRFYTDHTNVPEALEGLLRMYETRLKELNPLAKSITYDFNSLCQFIDELKEVAILSWDTSISGYKRYDKAWVKSALQELLTSMKK